MWCYYVALTVVIAEYLSMRHKILKGQRVPTVEYAVCTIYLYIYLFIGLSRSTVQSTIVYRVNLFTMPRMQWVVYVKLLKVLTATSCCLLLFAMNRIKNLIRQLSISLKHFSIDVAIE